MAMSNVSFRRQELYRLLGDLPSRDKPVDATQTGREEHDGYTLEKWTLDLNGLEPVPACFVRPTSAKGPLPTILYNHAHGGDYALGKDELLLGRDSLQNPPYAKELTAHGYAALCFDAWSFGGRATRTESAIFKQMLWEGRVMWGMMVHDSLRAIDWLTTRGDVDAERIGTLGLSMGSTMAWWCAALDGRVKVCIDLCCLTDFQALIETNNLDGHGVYYYVPSLLKSFTTAQINTLIAPRAHLSLQGTQDALTPPQGLDRIDGELKEIYTDAGVPDRWQLKRYNTGHGETPEMRGEVMGFLARSL